MLKQFRQLRKLSFSKMLGLIIFTIILVVFANSLRGQNKPTVQQNEKTVPQDNFVLKVTDGDTFTIRIKGKNEKVRLIGVDSPEVYHNKKDPGQEPWGTKAKKFAENLVLNKEVKVVTDVTPRDKYGRLLAYVYVGNTFVNLEMIKSGNAMLLTYPPNVAHVDEFTAAQKKAREANMGIWDRNNGLDTSPYQYRRNKK